ncbi:MAG: threonine synthase [Clostridia bacterium]|nr:threonine synthase [Clostridia bacterium]
MNYVSTRDRARFADAQEAVLKGTAPDGGLFTMDILPLFWQDDINKLCTMSYQQAAAFILKRYLVGYPEQELEEYCKLAYSTFSHPDVAPLVKLSRNLYSLELFHGKTCAFKDVALQLLPHLMVSAAKREGKIRETVILTATSGDTGKASLEAFADVDGTRIGVFYPDGGVSDVQRLQMTTQSGGNVNVFAIEGNFDDAQSGVKAIFADTALRERLMESGIALSSANSINWGRLAPQIVYYFWSYTRLLNSGEIKMGDKIDVCVPTGNFGNILAAYIAKKSGLPIERLICASNANNVLTDFFNTGIYDRNRDLLKTDSPSMDILVSSNLERLIFMLAGDDVTRELMAQLSKTGRYEAPADLRKKIVDAGFGAFCADDEEASEQIKKTWEAVGYLCDTHTAVALCAAQKAGTAARPMIVAATASPYKFAPAVLEALTGEKVTDGQQAICRLEETTGTKAPRQLAELFSKRERFNTVIAKQQMSDSVENWINTK